MKTKKRRRLELDTSPPSEARKQIEAEILAIRAVSKNMRPWLKAQIQHEVKNAVREVFQKLAAE